jgi:chemotaxis signal transduction protein
LDTVLEERRKSSRHSGGTSADGDTDGDAGVIRVLVCNHDERAVGLVVERIADIVEDRADVRSPATRKGVLYAAVIQERVTELLDLNVILGEATAGTHAPAREEDLAEVRA